MGLKPDRKLRTIRLVTRWANGIAVILGFLVLGGGLAFLALLYDQIHGVHP